MKLPPNHLYAYSKYTKLVEWGKLIALIGSAQAVIQAIGLISGILIIRLLSTQEYALYTLANTMLATMTLLGDSGISNGIMAQGGKVWQDKQKLGSVLVTGYELKRKFSIGSLLIMVPILFFLLLHHGASLLMSILILASIIPAFLSALSNAQLQVPLKLHQDMAALQTNQLVAGAWRLLSLCATLFLLPYAFIAIIVAGLSQIWSNFQLRKLSDKYVDWKQKVDPIIKKDIFILVRRMLPGIIYYCLSGQITIWIISAFGSTTALAQVGALGRLSMVLNVFGMIFYTLIVPRYARMSSREQSLLNRFIQIQISLLLLYSSVIVIFWLFPTEMLWVLGKSYAGLDNDLQVSIIGSCLYFMGGTNFHLYSSRGWTLNQLIYIPINIATIICGAMLFNISTIHGIFLLNILIGGVQFLIHLTYGLITIIKFEPNTQV